jgi:uncharacterized protein YkwD
MNVCNTSKTSNLEKDVKEQFLYMRPISRRAVFRGLSGTALGALVVGGMRIPIDAAAGFADPAFEAQWRAGEAIAPNFWGPLSTATGAVQEAYREVAGGQRLVQYFDKGRMELTDGGVTNGLLAREIITGMIQTGNESYEHRPAPTIPIAGDTDNPGPTYAALNGKASGLLLAAPARIGMRITTTVAADGTIAMGDSMTGSDPTTVSAYDPETKHNVPQVFAQYRERASVAAIGLAIAEPFATTVKVGGTAKQVLIQPFERRVLTYTADNPPPFQVEMGNIGQHYLRWRYGDSPPIPASPATPSDQLDAEEADFLARINAYRIQNSLPPLTISPGLMRTAKWLSADMAAKGYFSHTDSLGRDLTARLHAFGVTGNTSWGENIAAGNASAAETFQQWQASPDHNENMLRPTFTTIGIGRAQGAAPYHWYWTTDFGNA